MPPRPLVFFFCVFAGADGRFEIVEVAKHDAFAIHYDLRFPLTIGLDPIDALHSGGAVFLRATVTVVLCVRCLAQIDDTIVGLLAVDVVDLMRRPPSVNEPPSKTVCENSMSAHCYCDVSFDVSCPRNLSDASFS